MSFFTFLKRPRPTEGWMGGPLYHPIKEALTDVQAYARSHGGNIELRDVTADGDVHIKLTGACDGCPMSDLTLKHGIEEQLKAAVPGIKRIVQD